MQRIGEKNLFDFDNLLKFNVKSSFGLKLTPKVSLSFNDRRFAAMPERSVNAAFVAIHLISAFPTPAMIRHAAASFHTRKGDLHGLKAMTSGYIVYPDFLTDRIIQNNFDSILDYQRLISFGADWIGGSLSMGVSDIRKFTEMKTFPFRYSNQKVGLTLSFDVFVPSGFGLNGKISRMLLYSYFLSQHVIYPNDHEA